MKPLKEKAEVATDFITKQEVHRILALLKQNSKYPLLSNVTLRGSSYYDTLYFEHVDDCGYWQFKMEWDGYRFSTVGNPILNHMSVSTSIPDEAISNMNEVTNIVKEYNNTVFARLRRFLISHKILMPSPLRDEYTRILLQIRRGEAYESTYERGIAQSLKYLEGYGVCVSDLTERYAKILKKKIEQEVKYRKYTKGERELREEDSRILDYFDELSRLGVDTSEIEEEIENVIPHFRHRS